MWYIAEVKRNGWRNVKRYYGLALLVIIIIILLGAETGGILLSAWLNHSRIVVIIISIFSGNPTAANSMPTELQNFLVDNSLVFFLLVCLIIIAFKAFVCNPLTVGKNRYFMESREMGKSAGAKSIVWAFRSGHYLNIIKIMFLRDFHTYLWQQLFYVPGIIKRYEYSMIPYILSENPEISKKHAFGISRQMMDNNKFNLFVFELSFIGWYLLMSLTLCIGMIAVIPYIEAAQVEIYMHLRGGISDFPFRGFGISEEASPKDTARSVCGH